MTTPYTEEPTRQSIESMKGPVVIEFGTDWCGFCKAAQPVIERGFEDFSHVTHLKVEDGKGKPLGRGFRVKLWPTLIFLKDGVEVARVVRPTDAAAIVDGLRQVSAS